MTLYVHLPKLCVPTTASLGTVLMDVQWHIPAKRLSVDHITVKICCPKSANKIEMNDEQNDMDEDFQKLDNIFDIIWINKNIVYLIRKINLLKFYFITFFNSVKIINFVISKVQRLLIVFSVNHFRLIFQWRKT